jgi:predicted metallopeptidase
MAEWKEAPDLTELAERVIACRDEVAHVEADRVFFLWECETKPKALARCYRLIDHPIGLFTDKPFAVVFYQQVCDVMTEAQLALLMLHELMHIPPIGDKLVDHDVKDFRAVLGIDRDWTEPGREVPNILE